MSHAEPLELPGAWTAAASILLAQIDSATRAKGAGYMQRITLLGRRGPLFRFEVAGTHKYQLAVRFSTQDPRCAASCSCPAFQRGSCKHLAAVLTALVADNLESSSGAISISPELAFAEFVANAANCRASVACARLSLWLGVALPVPSSSAEFRDFLAEEPAGTALREQLAAAVPPLLAEIELASGQARAWPGAVRIGDGGPCARDIRRLTRLLNNLAKELPREDGVPLPPSALNFSSEALTRCDGFRVSHLHADCMHTFVVEFRRGSEEALFSADAPAKGLRANNSPDLVQFAALKWLLAELADPESAVHERAHAWIAAPPWLRAMERLESAEFAEPAAQTRVFALLLRKSEIAIHLQAYAKSPTTRYGWRAASFSELGSADDEATRVLGFMLPSHLQTKKQIELRDLQDQLPTFATQLGKVAHLFGEDFAPPPTLSVQALRLGFQESAKQALHAQLLHAETRLPMATTLAQYRGGSRRAIATWLPNQLLVSVVSAALVPWLDSAIEFGDAALEFPRDAFARLRELSTRIAQQAPAAIEIPGALRGHERSAATRAAIALEWRNGATVELLVEIVPGAPLARAGVGPKAIAFTMRGEAQWITRDFRAEAHCIDEIFAELSPLVVWNDNGDRLTGACETPAQTYALLEYLRDKSSSICIETRFGAPPVFAEWHELNGRVKARERGEFFEFGADLGLGTQSIPLGDILTAIRQAQRFVRFGESGYLRLTAELAHSLAPLAFAAELQSDGSLLVPHGLGSAVLAARAILDESPEVNWFALEQRLAIANQLAHTPQLEAGSLRDYQREGASWMLHLAEWAPGCVLADDMGLGKTVQTAAVLLARAKLGPSIVVAPASVTFNWAAELARFAPSLKLRNLYAEPELDWSALKAGEVVVASYGMLMRMQNTDTAHFGTAVLDEAQYLKNRLTKRAIAVAKLQRGFTIALSGTPIENHLGELWSIFSLVFPGLLGSAKAFHLRFRENIEGVPESPALAALRELLRPFLLRRTRADVLAELPPREDFTEFIRLGQDERTRYEALRKACELEFLREDKRLSVAQKRIQIFAAITNLRQLACHPALVDPTYAGGSQKLERLIELCTSATSRGASVLVFSQFTKLLKRAQAALQSAELSTGYLDGATIIAAREKLVASFQAGQFQVFCISLMAGGTGLNLTQASYVVHLDPWWNPAVEEQATSRAHRMGQANRVTTYRLVAKDTIEESILALQDNKRSLVCQVLEGHGEATTLGVRELVALLQPTPVW